MSFRPLVILQLISPLSRVTRSQIVARPFHSHSAWDLICPPAETVPQWS